MRGLSVKKITQSDSTVERTIPDGAIEIRVPLPAYEPAGIGRAVAAVIETCAAWSILVETEEAMEIVALDTTSNKAERIALARRVYAAVWDACEEPRSVKPAKRKRSKS